MTFTAPLSLFFHVHVLRQRLIGATVVGHPGTLRPMSMSIDAGVALVSAWEHARTIAAPFVHCPALCSGGIRDRCALPVHSHPDGIIGGEDRLSFPVPYSSDVFDELCPLLRREPALLETRRCSASIPGPTDYDDLFSPLLDRPTQFPRVLVPRCTSSVSCLRRFSGRQLAYVNRMSDSL